MSHLSPEAIEKDLIRQGVPPAKARARAKELASGQPPAPAKGDSRIFIQVGSISGLATETVSAQRRGDVFELVIHLAPRTKKNSSRGCGQVSAAYARYARSVVPKLEQLAPFVSLPLPDVPYNAKAVFYPDLAGEQADPVGFYQALADLLETGGVLSNDRYIRRWWGSDVVHDHGTTPRTELLLTPIL
jgi:hypothetical protein